MRVRVPSPWETVSTSVKAKKRSRSADGYERIALRFASLRRPGKSKRSRRSELSGEQEPFTPTVVLTSERRISLVGTDARDGSLTESELMQYSANPANKEAFLPSNDSSSGPRNGKKKQSELSPIPAICDARHDLVYAFQAGNTKLSCWSSTTGPDEAKTISLGKSPAIDSQIYRDSSTGLVFVYGSCEDGSMYLVQRLTDGSLHLQHLSLPQEAAPLVASVVATVIHDPATEHSVSAGTKRKSRSLSVSSSNRLFLSQVATDWKADSLVLLCHKLQIHLDADGLARASIAETDTRSTPLLPREQLQLVRLAGVSETTNTVILLCTAEVHGSGKENGSRSVDQKHFSILAQLDPQNFSVSPMELPPDTVHIGLVTPKVLVVGTERCIMFTDLVRGGCLRQEMLPEREVATGYTLATDTSKGRLAVVSTSKFKDALECHVPCGDFQAFIKTLHQQPPNLARSLGSSLSHSRGTKMSAERFLPHETKFLTGEPVDDTTRKAISVMVRAYSMLLDQQAKTTAASSVLMDAYECALQFVCGASDRVDGNFTKERTSVPSNGNARRLQDTVKQLNGTNGPNHTHLQRGETVLPTAFVNCAATIAVQVLSQPNMLASIHRDASLVLGRVLKTKKVLARTHLSPDANSPASFSTLINRLQRIQQQEYTTMRFIVDVLRFCCDLSEAQLVAMLRYVLTRASTDEINNVVHSNGCASSGGIEVNGGKIATASVPEVVVKGVSIILDLVLSYGSCNDGLLRAALSTGLNSTELVLLARILEKKAASPNSLQWIAALADCLQVQPERISGSVVTRLLRRASKEISSTEALLSLQPFLAEKPHSKPERNATSYDESAHLPPYQLERLLF